MIEALNMQLETIRTVLHNEVNEISVCADLKRDTGVFYTLISITSAPVRRQLAVMLATEEIFSSNRDFLGSFSQGDRLNLLFAYHEENLLSRRETLYAVNFARRRQMVESMLVALAEIQLANSVGLLLLDERNLNISSDGKVYFNYFLDFSRWNTKAGENDFYYKIAWRSFELLSREYRERFEGDIARYPTELQVLLKKIQHRSFPSFNSILSFVKTIPDEPTEPSVGWRKLRDRIFSGIAWAKNHALEIFLVVIVLVTLAFTIYQIAARLLYQDAVDKNTLYNGLESIGEVYLGDENV